MFPASSGLLQGRSMLLLGYSGLLCGALDRSTLFQLLSATPCYSRSPRVAPGFLQLSSRLLQANSRLLCFAPLVPGLLQVTPCCSSLPRGIPRCSGSHRVVPRLLQFALGLLHVTPRCWGGCSRSLCVAPRCSRLLHLALRYFHIVPRCSRLLHVAPGCADLLHLVLRLLQVGPGRSDCSQVALRRSRWLQGTACCSGLHPHAPTLFGLLPS